MEKKGEEGGRRWEMGRMEIDEGGGGARGGREMRGKEG